MISFYECKFVVSFYWFCVLVFGILSTKTCLWTFLLLIQKEMRILNLMLLSKICALLHLRFKHLAVTHNFFFDHFHIMHIIIQFAGRLLQLLNNEFNYSAPLHDCYFSGALCGLAIQSTHIWFVDMGILMLGFSLAI